MRDEDTPTGELREVDVQFLSLVKKGANKRPFKIFKSAGYDEDKDNGLETEEAKQAAGFFKLVKQFFAGSSEPEKNPVEKADGEAVLDFKTRVSLREIELWKMWDAISETFWQLVRSDLEDKRSRMEQSLLQFNEQMLRDFDTLTATVEISKSERSEIEKAGRKISASRLEALKAARTHLDEVISAAEAAEKEPIEKGEDIDMKPEELKAIIKGSVDEALAPVNERLDKIEKGEQEEEKETELTPEAIAKSVKDAIGEAVTPLETRISKMEKMRGISNQEQEGDEDEEGDERGRISKSDKEFSWGGLFS